VAIDLLEMEPVAGVDFVQGDFTRGSGLQAIEALLAGRKADVVLSDMAPNMSGIAVSDQARSLELAERARDFAVLHLKPEGVFLVKIFQGAGYDDYLLSLRRAFVKVLVRKPDASRDESAEQYLLARGPQGLETRLPAAESDRKAVSPNHPLVLSGFFRRILAREQHHPHHHGLARDRSHPDHGVHAGRQSPVERQHPRLLDLHGGGAPGPHRQGEARQLAHAQGDHARRQDLHRLHPGIRTRGWSAT
jgi:hypothetical protein